MALRRHIPILAALIAVPALQMALSAADATYYLTQVTMAIYSCLTVVGLSLLMGCAGQVSLGQAGFFAAGGYLAAFLTTHDLAPMADARFVRALDAMSLLVQRETLYGAKVTHLSPWPAFAAAVAIAGVIALLIGLPVIRLRGHYLAMATLGFGIIVYRVVLGTPAFGEADGISDVPPFRLFAGLEVNGRAPFRVQNYYIACAATLLVMVLASNLMRSRMGRALRAIHEDEEAARSLGIDVARAKLSVFVLSALLAAIGGALTAHYNGSIGPSSASAMRSVRYVAIVAAGGMANLWGTLLTGLILTFLSLRGVFGSFDDAVFGLVLIVTMMFAPGGLLRLPSRPAWLRRKADAAGAP
ncbi:MAG: branched-chain amino acid ABC transporter permease [Burkholderiaceae bacterium]|nr:branched-chain amino acid ABC transporter permease [Burkholderiaceae bacterium]